MFLKKNKTHKINNQTIDILTEKIIEKKKIASAKISNSLVKTDSF